jgi:hypothetical protein
VVVVLRPGAGRNETSLLVCERSDVVCIVDDRFQVRNKLTSCVTIEKKGLFVCLVYYRQATEGPR